MEGKKVLWVVFSIALALVVILAAGLFLLRPRQPASAAQVRPGAAPSLEGYDPYEYVRGSSAPPGLTPPPAESEPVVIVVGEPPASLPPAQPAESAIAPLESPRERAPAMPAPEAQSAVKPERPSAPPERVAATPIATAAKPAKQTAAKPAAKPTAKPTAKPAAKPAAKPKSVSVTEYWIQAGSFSSASRAEEVSRRLEERGGLATRTITRDLNGKTHFRVRVGPYASRAEAEKFLGWIQELKGFETSYISMVASRRSMP